MEFTSNDSIREIVLNLPLPDVGSFLSTCKKFKSLDDDNLWKALLMRDFDEKNLEGITDYKKHYRSLMGNFDITFKSKYLPKGFANIYIRARSLAFSEFAVDATKVFEQRVLKRANNKFFKPIFGDMVYTLDVNTFCKLDGPWEPLDTCCNTCGGIPVSIRTYGGQFDHKGEAKLFVNINCTPSHQRSKKHKLGIQFSIKSKRRKLETKITEMTFKKGKAFWDFEEFNPGCYKG